MRWFDFFIDPVLRGPVIASMLMAIAASVVGVLLFVRKRTLIGETLSHTTYPGVTVAVMISALFPFSLPFWILLGAFFSSVLGYMAVEVLRGYCRLKDDAALTFVLAAFFGIGITIASYVQNIHTHEYRQIQSYLYGQAATMTDIHIWIYGGLSLFIIFALLIFYRPLVTTSFDRAYANASGVGGWKVEALLLFLVVLAATIGIRSCGVVLMSALFIAPAIAARQFTNRIWAMFILSAFFGALSGFLGNYFSVILSYRLFAKSSLPTGPMIVIIAGSIALYALVFAPTRGLAFRLYHRHCFRRACMEQQFVRIIGYQPATFREMRKQLGLSRRKLLFLLLRLRFRKQVLKRAGKYLVAPGQVEVINALF
ncbi:MAG: metal ABC transporter permease [Chlamydiales bacterium]